MWGFEVNANLEGGNAAVMDSLGYGQLDSLITGLTQEFPKEYGFVKSAPQSPESGISGDSFCSDDHLDIASDEDFLTQLSNELDIPFLLNPEDDNGILNSYLDRSPDEIMSEISGNSPILSSSSSLNDGSDDFPTDIPMDLLNFELDLPMSPKQEPLSDDSNYAGSCRSISRGSASPVKSETAQSPDSPQNYSPTFVKIEPTSPQISTSSKALSASTVKRPASKTLQGTPNKIQKPTVKAENKTIPIQPKIKPKVIAPINPFNGNQNMVFIKNELPQIINASNRGMPVNTTQKVVVLSNQSFVPVATINTATTTIPVPQFKNTLTPISNQPGPINSAAPKVVKVNNTNPSNGANSNIDPRILKKHQRKIKNREAASLSRKKKKDYLNSLEDKVQELTVENERLTKENVTLRERLSLYENVTFDKKYLPNIQGKNAKLALCVFLLVVGFNLDFLRRPFSLRMDLQNFKEVHKIPDHHSRGLLWTVDDGGGETNVKNETMDERKNSSINYFTMCPVFINQTESARLVLELEKWIGKPMTPYFHQKNYSQPETLKENPEKLPSNFKNSLRKLGKKKTRVNLPVAVTLGNYGPENQKRNEIQVFSPSAEQLYSEFFEAINRRDDTFYVVSFNEHHMLLPALYHNKTRRPKMSFLMPNPMMNDTSFPNSMPLMQIDCEVLDTKLVNVKYGSIPSQYRNGNVTKNEKTQSGDTGNAEDAPRKNGEKLYKPYFLYKNLSKHMETADDKYEYLTNLTQNVEIIKP